MSGDSSAEKTEEPTPKKLRDIRKKGQVPKSKEIVSTALIVFLFLYFGFAWHGILDTIKAVVVYPSLIISEPFPLALKNMLHMLLMACIKIILPFVGIVVSIGFLANILQNGIVFSVEPIKPDIKKINPVEGFKKIFSQSNFVEFIKSIIKVLTVTGCVAYIIYINVESLIHGPLCGLECLVLAFSSMLTKLVIYVCLIFILVAGIDLGYQRFDFVKKNRMTKDQVKKDHKESDGDPEIKGKRKRLQRELASGQALDSVKKANVVVKNPTHFAVAIRYHAQDCPLPIVIAKGENLIAKRILEIAKENGIPILENVPLARGLYSGAAIDEYIPVDFIPAVVEVLHWVKDNYPDFEPQPWED